MNLLTMARAAARRGFRSRQRSLTDLDGQVTAINRSHLVVEFSVGGKILSVNDNFCRLMGFSPLALIGQHLRRREREGRRGLISRVGRLARDRKRGRLRVDGPGVRGGRRGLVAGAVDHSDMEDVRAIHQAAVGRRGRAGSVGRAVQ